MHTYYAILALDFCHSNKLVNGEEKLQMCLKSSELVLERSLKGIEKEINGLKKRLERNSFVQKQLQDNAMSLRIILQDAEHRARAFQEHMIANAGIPDEVGVKREIFIRHVEALITTDQRLSERAFLDGRISELSEELQKMCGHEFVINCDNYVGVGRLEGNDMYIGRRMCLVCGLRENSQSKTGNMYEFLAMGPERLVKSHNGTLQSWKTLFLHDISFIQQLFSKASGEDDLIWLTEG